MKKLLIILACAGVAFSTAIPVRAATGEMLGLGYFRPDAPVGARFWFSDRIGGDLGIGFGTQKVQGAAGTEPKTKLNFQLDLGIPIVLSSDETTKWFVRPGFEYVKETPSFNAGTNDYINPKDIIVSGSLGVEHFISKKFSVQVAHGVRYRSHDFDVANVKKDNHFETEAFGVSDIGFHYYFWQP